MPIRAAANDTQGRARLAIDLVTTILILGGDTLWWFLTGGRAEFLNISPLLWTGIVLLVVRHAVWPRPTIVHVLWTRAFASSRPAPVSRIVSLAVITRATVLAVGLAASLTYPGRLAVLPRVAAAEWQNLPARWDAFWYVGIARHGYHREKGKENGQEDYAFFPAYPALMRIAGDLVTVPAKLFNAPHMLGSGEGRVAWGGVLVSIVCFALALPRTYRLAREDGGDDEQAMRACVLIALFPFALFFSCVYSEALAFLALVATILAWRTDRTAGGVLWGLTLGLTRSNGWTLSAAFLADRTLSVWRPGRRPFAPPRHWVGVAAAPLAGALLFSVFVDRLTGHPFAWATAQHAWGNVLRPWSFFVERWQAVQDYGLRGYIARDPVDAVSLVVVAMMIGCAIRLAVERQWLYAAIIVCYLAPAIAINLPAIGRMTSLLFPAFFLLARRFRGVTFAAVAILFAVAQAWLAWRFFLWKMPF
ncbi:MAG TPA: mannosyltransferase family protein [Vicinamibacterales bacterium]|nr:mannosyltransferase family protein [Vicinamibacterales bacterium]